MRWICDGVPPSCADCPFQLCSPTLHSKEFISLPAALIVCNSKHLPIYVSLSQYYIYWGPCNVFHIYFPCLYCSVPWSNTGVNVMSSTRESILQMDFNVDSFSRGFLTNSKRICSCCPFSGVDCCGFRLASICFQTIAEILVTLHHFICIL